jgi:hypothetical protein
MKLIFYKVLLLSYLLSGCVTTLEDKLFVFTTNELTHIHAYKPGDTLFFENGKNQVDSFLILNFETEIRGQKQGLINSIKPESDYSVLITQLDKVKAKSFGELKVINGDTIEVQELTSFIKYPPSQTIYYDFSFLTFYTLQDSIFGQFHSDTVYLNKTAITNYYSIEPYHPDQLDSTNIEELLWTDKEGLVAYKFKKGTWWTKQSSNR